MVSLVLSTLGLCVAHDITERLSAAYLTSMGGQLEASCKPAKTASQH
jgi:hypothetical protein